MCGCPTRAGGTLLVVGEGEGEGEEERAGRDPWAWADGDVCRDGGVSPTRCLPRGPLWTPHCAPLRYADVGLMGWRAAGTL